MEGRERILIVDDEWNMRNLLKVHLFAHFETAEAADGPEALALLAQQRFSLVILDIMMPGMDGWEVCAKIRETSQVPILMLTARGDVKDKVEGLSAGADDYLVKPFNAEELVARVKALIRRSQLTPPTDAEDVIQIADLKIDRQARLVYAGTSVLDLTPKEFDLIELLATHPKIIFTREMLMDRVWGIHEVREMRTADTHVKNVREKFRKHGLSFNPIRTVWGKGYTFQRPDAAQ
ncbi:response regulator transcription factor [Planococcus lenghuensis]|uniref:DNA-binding response regulator n=1 Tax=Planococcus lenghuensis TaxID=2213202 RepID=A0A1Q2KYQ1_9BACL|nr:response regulator transcription factor [Planococcus lenghuensis]AQQ53338.1 DNA-binding response regulator [Planococcus lenghuensis]